MSVLVAASDSAEGRAALAAGAIEARLRETELLEGVASGVSEGFRLPRNLTIRAKVCGEPNAYWEAESGELTVCYELVRDYLELHADLGGGATETGNSATAEE